MKSLHIKIMLDQSVTEHADSLHDMLFDIADAEADGQIAGQVFNAEGIAVGEWTIYEG